MIINFILLTFFVMFLGSVLLNNQKLISGLNIAGIFLVGLSIFSFAGTIAKNDSLSFFNNLIYIDSLGFIQLLLISTISFIAILYSHKYIKHELEQKAISLRKAKIYYLLFGAFVFFMLSIALSNNIMVMWIGLEATTLSTAFLIGFNSNKFSLEAAWKYIIICSVGIVIGLVGIILFIYASGNHASTSDIFKWTYLIKHYGILQKHIVKIAFVFVFIGIGTKAGLAPMHTWLPDGHSEAPSPISALMSGILLNLALYVIVKFYAIVKLISGLENLKYLFIVFGCLSLLISAFSILKQNNYKRLLAFSSIENIGIVSLGFGIGGFLGTFAAILHSVIHAFGKTLLFLTAGNVLQAYKTRRIDKIHCLIKTMPVNAIYLILGMLVITGAPPFASFFSEYKIMLAGIKADHYYSVSLYLICLLLIFAGFLKSFIKMVFDHKPNQAYEKSAQDKDNIIPLFVTFAFIVLISIFFNSYLEPIFHKAALLTNG